MDHSLEELSLTQLQKLIESAKIEYQNKAQELRNEAPNRMARLNGSIDQLSEMVKAIQELKLAFTGLEERSEEGTLEPMAVCDILEFITAIVLDLTVTVTNP